MTELAERGDPAGDHAEASAGAPRDPSRPPVTVPAGRYTDADFAALEHERLWPRVWQLACSLDHVAQPGDWFEYRAGRLSVVIVRGDDDVLRAFQNVCLHRGNELCHGSGAGATELRCGFHRWSWDLAGRLREVPSRRDFGTLPNDDYGLPAVRVDTWGPLVFVNLDTEAGTLHDFLGPVPADADWLALDEFRCRYLVSVGVPANWKTTADGFSETYHVQGIHPELLRVYDDLDSPQVIWGFHGKSSQPYGRPSGRLRPPPDDQEMWDAFAAVYGDRAGFADTAGPVPAPPPGGSIVDVLAAAVRARAASNGVDLDRFTDQQVLDIEQYNVFPNITLVMLPDLITVLRARPGLTPDDATLDLFVLDRRPADDLTPRTKPADVEVDVDTGGLGLVIDQDLDVLRRIQRGLHQPAFHRVTLSHEECRIIARHRGLEAYLGIEPSQITGDRPMA